MRPTSSAHRAVLYKKCALFGYKKYTKHDLIFIRETTVCMGKPPQRIGFLRRFGMKRGMDFAYFGLELGIVFEETKGVYERICRFNSN